QPELAIVRNGAGAGPFQIDPKQSKPGELWLSRTIVSPDEETTRRDQVALSAAPAARAVKAFATGDSDLGLGGTFADLPFAHRVRLPRNSLRFDPASGLFGFLPTRSGTPLDDSSVRRLLSEAIDRDALVDALRVPGLNSRATVLEPGLDGVPNPVPPPWT